MSKRTLRSDDVDGFVRAWHDEVRDTELRYGVECEFTLRTADLKSQLRIHGEAWYTDQEGTRRLVGTVDRLYPTPRVVYLHAACYQAAMSLNVAVQRWYFEKNGNFFSSPVE